MLNLIDFDNAAFTFPSLVALGVTALPALRLGPSRLTYSWLIEKQGNITPAEFLYNVFASSLLTTSKLNPFSLSSSSLVYQPSTTDCERTGALNPEALKPEHTLAPSLLVLKGE